jgi:hypothetical protein
MWNVADHTKEDNLRWAWLRAVEWIDWPLFLSQFVVPILLCFYPWQWVVGGLLVLVFIWRNFVASWWVSTIAGYGPPLVLLKFITAPSSAFILWKQHHFWLAPVALLWPWIGPLFVGFLLVIPQAVVEALTPIGNQAQVGAVQQRFLKRLGFIDGNTAG